MASPSPSSPSRPIPWEPLCSLEVVAAAAKASREARSPLAKRPGRFKPWATARSWRRPRSRSSDRKACVFVGGGGRGGQGVTGSPLSAREETRTVQTLGDGTQLETSEVTQFYRDSQGRTRTEQTLQGRSSIIVLDPVASVRLLMDPAAKSATRVTMVSMAARGGRGGAAGVAAPAGAYTIIRTSRMLYSWRL